HCGQENADSVRSLLLVEARAPLSSVTRLYEQGAAAERRAVLLTLHRLDLGDTALPLVEDALRANDTRLVAAAVGPYAADHLDP
ncbi:EboA domain-containing protein, partial [Streptomyces anulatus]